MSKRSTGHIFRTFCVDQENIDRILAIPCKYVIIGKETCPTTGKAHLQGYIEFKSAKSSRAAKRCLGDRTAHTEHRLGTPFQAWIYCEKEGDYRSRGSKPSPSEPGKRSDIGQLRTLLLSGANVRDCLSVTSSFQAVRFAQTWLSYNERRGHEGKPHISWFHGATGAGKTRMAYSLAQRLGSDVPRSTIGPVSFDYVEGRIWWSTKSLKWWPGYDGQPVVIIDDFRRDFCTFHELLRVLDRYPYSVEIKGGHRLLKATHIFITSPLSPTETYDTREDIGQLTRRIDVIKLFDQYAV